MCNEDNTVRYILLKMVKAHESMLAFIYLLFHHAPLLPIVKAETYQMRS